jgi:hypothetical protein
MSEFDDENGRDEYITTSIEDCIRESCGDFWAYRNPTTGFIDYWERRREIPNVPCERQQEEDWESWLQSFIEDDVKEFEEGDVYYWNERDER